MLKNSRWLRATVFLGLPSVGLVTMIILASIWSVFAPGQFFDPGVAARWGVPVLAMVSHLLLAVLLGTLLFALYCLSPADLAYQKSLSLAAWVGVALVPTLVGTVAFNYLNSTGVGWNQTGFVGAVLGFLDSGLGSAWILALVFVLIASMMVFIFRKPAWIAVAFVFSVAAIVPVAFQSHASGTGGHGTAVMASSLHAFSASVWAGGLVAIIFVAPSLKADRLELVISRFSTLAFLSFWLIIFSGTVSAWLRLENPLQLFTTPYGLEVTIKIVLTAILAFLGLINRRILVGKLARAKLSRSRVILGVVGVEVLIMGAVFGVAGVLSRTLPPVLDVPIEASSAGVTPAQILSGATLPPPESFVNYLIQISIDPIWLTISLFGLAFYITGFVVLRRRGDKWPIGRLISWILGTLVLLYLTNGGVMVYGVYLFSAHMIMHMSLGMIVPIFLAMGAPITMLVRVVPVRKDGSRGFREWVLAIVQSRVGNLLSNPWIAAAIFIISMWVFYYSPLFRWAMTDPLGHQWMTAHFLISGYLFAQSILAVDPVGHKFRYPTRMLVLVLAMAAHAFFGVEIMSTTFLLLPDWFGAMGRTWGPAPLLDQQLGGAIAWGITEIPTIVLVVVLMFRWFKSDQREAKRRDRAAARDGDLEWKAYNERLARLSGQK